MAISLSAFAAASAERYLRGDPRAKQRLTGGGCAALLGENAMVETGIKQAVSTRS